MTRSSRRFWTGAGYGLIATFAMSGVMAVDYMLGARTLPGPIPLGLIAGLVSAVLGLREITMLAVILAVPIHFAYGALWAGLLAVSTQHVTWWKGLVVGIGLWMIMLVFFVPIAGRYTFTIATSANMWIATLLMHAVYGITAGLLQERHEPQQLAEEM